MSDEDVEFELDVDAAEQPPAAEPDQEEVLEAELDQFEVDNPPDPATEGTEGLE